MNAAFIVGESIHKRSESHAKATSNDKGII